MGRGGPNKTTEKHLPSSYILEGFAEGARPCIAHSHHFRLIDTKNRSLRAPAPNIAASPFLPCSNLIYKVTSYIFALRNGILYDGVKGFKRILSFYYLVIIMYNIQCFISGQGRMFFVIFFSVVKYFAYYSYVPGILHSISARDFNKQLFGSYWKETYLVSRF